MISTQVGFIAKLKGTLTKKHYTVDTVFVDHYSRLKYIHLMTKLTSKETMEAKQAFEHFAEQHSIRILHYHCDNELFADNAFLGSSPSHARYVYLVLNLHTGCVSLQYHCRFEDISKTVRHGGPNVSVLTAWH